MLSLCFGTFGFYKEQLQKLLFGLNHNLFSTQQQMNIIKEVKSFGKQSNNTINVSQAMQITPKLF